MKPLFSLNGARTRLSGLFAANHRRWNRLSPAMFAEIMEERVVLSETSIVGTGTSAFAMSPIASAQVMALATYAAQVGSATASQSAPGIGSIISGIGSDVWVMATNPLATTGGFVGGVGTTFVSGEAADSYLGSISGLGTSMFGWTGLEFANTSVWGNDEAFANGQVVGAVWGTANNIALTASGLASLPNLITVVGGGLGGATTIGTVVTVGGTVTVVVSTEATIAVALGVEGTIALATNFGNEPPPEHPSETFETIDDAIGETSIEGSTIVGSEPTGNPTLIDLGFTETIYVEDSAGVQWTVWHNPSTGEFFAHPSSGFRGL